MNDHTRPCRECGAPITPGPRERNKRKWCSDKCRRTNYYRRYPEARQRASEKASKRHRESYQPKRYELKCAICGDLFQGHRPDQMYCRDKCRYDAGWLQSKRKKSQKERAEARPCNYCGKPLARTATADGLHRKCARIPAWLREGKPGPKQRRALKILEEAARGRTAKRVWTQGNCPWCGTEFMSPNAKFCSKRCRENDRLRRRQPFAFKPSPADREALRVRDGDDCQLCMRTIDFTLTHPHLWSVSVDHIEPQSHALIPDHSLPNLRLAHLLCNSIRSDDTEMGAEHVRSATEMRWTADQLASAA